MVIPGRRDSPWTRNIINCPGSDPTIGIKSNLVYRAVHFGKPRTEIWSGPCSSRVKMEYPRHIWTMSDVIHHVGTTSVLWLVCSMNQYSTGSRYLFDIADYLCGDCHRWIKKSNSARALTILLSYIVCPVSPAVLTVVCIQFAISSWLYCSNPFWEKGTILRSHGHTYRIFIFKIKLGLFLLFFYLFIFEVNDALMISCLHTEYINLLKLTAWLQGVQPFCVFVLRLYFSARAIWGRYNHWTRINHLSQRGQILGHRTSYHQGNRTQQQQQHCLVPNSSPGPLSALLGCTQGPHLSSAQTWGSCWLRCFWRSFKGKGRGAYPPSLFPSVSHGLLTCAFIHLIHSSNVTLMVRSATIDLWRRKD